MRREISDSVFSFKSQDSILKPQHLGISGSRVSVLTPAGSVTGLASLQAVPYANTGFRSEIRIDGEDIPCDSYVWRVSLLERRGRSRRFEVTSMTVIPPHKNTVIQAVTIKNRTDRSRNIPLELWYRGNTEYCRDWVFDPPVAARKEPEEVLQTENRLILQNKDGSSLIMTSSLNLKLFEKARILQGRAEIAPGGSVTVYFSFHSGKGDTTDPESRLVAEDYEKYMDEAFLWEENQEKRLLDTLPSFSCEDERYRSFYYRSLVTLLMNRWEIPLFRLNPYYSTGGTGGGCMCSYLWDFAAPWEIMPLTDPETVKEEIKAFLAVDLGKSYAIMPVDGKANGPWYPINQEKIVALIYYYLANTGDLSILDDTAGDRTVIEWVKFHAYFGDDPGEAVSLIDYGIKGEDHLELRKGIPYHGILPDLNARRYLTYRRASEILSLYGTPDEKMMDRAEQLKELVKKELWDREKKWFRFLIDGKEGIRYTVQMFKFLDSPGIDDEIREGLLTHLNEEEFLSEFGLHSMSKLDEAYDQDDIDNGGGGICSIFVPAILHQLYTIGKCGLANDIFRRVLWWGERMPYWGDSLTANAIAYREDTPLQAAIGSSAGAQMMIFGIFGIRADFEGRVTINPVKEAPASNMRLTDMKLRGKTFSVFLEEESYTVEYDGKRQNSPYGQKITL